MVNIPEISGKNERPDVRDVLAAQNIFEDPPTNLEGAMNKYKDATLKTIDGISL